MKHKMPLFTLFAVCTPLIVVSLVSYNSKYFVLDNPDFWYGYMGYVGTVGLAGAALWQNEFFRKENRRKEELEIRPYLYATFEYKDIDSVVDTRPDYLHLVINEDKTVKCLGVKGAYPQDISTYFSLKEQITNFDTSWITKAEQMQKQHTLGDIYRKKNETVGLLTPRYMFITCNIKNHGNGSAINVELTLNGERILPIFCLSHDDQKYIYLIIDGSKLKVNQKAEFNFQATFFNVQDFGPYIQNDGFSITKSDSYALEMILSEQRRSPKLKK